MKSRPALLYRHQNCLDCDFAASVLSDLNIHHHERSVDDTEDRKAIDEVFRLSERFTLPVVQLSDGSVVLWPERESDNEPACLRQLRFRSALCAKVKKI